MKKIKKFDLSFSPDDIDIYLNSIKKILKSGFLAEGNFVKKFEKEFKKLTKSKDAIMVGSGTDALEIAFKIVKKKKIILQANNFFAAHVALENANKEPLYCDLELDSLGIDCNHLEKLLMKDSEIGAVCIVHTGGLISKNIDKIVKICKKFSVLLIEDAAHAHGSFKNNQHAGTFGDIGCFSFFSTKVMTTGEGGAIVTNNIKYSKLIRSLKDFGREYKDSWIRKVRGSNCKVTEMQAALGLLELKRLSSRMLKRKKLANKIKTDLKNSNFKIYWPEKQQKCSFYKIFLEHLKYDASKIEKILHKNKLPLSGKVWLYPLHKQPKYIKKGLNLKNTDQFVKKHFSIPIYPELDIGIISKYTKFLKKI